jgi:hypothetical protein
VIHQALEAWDVKDANVLLLHGDEAFLKLETVSRAFSRFQEEGFIAVQQKHIRILDIQALSA